MSAYSPFKYSKQERSYEWGDWAIQSVGGFCTVRHFWAENETRGMSFWRFKLSEAVADALAIEQSPAHFDMIHRIHKGRLFN